MITLPKRKSTRLKKYDYNTPTAYFITVCAKDRAPIFSRIDVGGGAFDAPNVVLTRIGQAAEKHLLSSDKIMGVSVDKDVIMPNHIHLLLRIRDNCGTSRAPSPTNSTVSHVISTFKRFTNKTVGHNVFQRSFYDHVVRGEGDYSEIWEYIENNPARWANDEFFTE